MYEERITLWSSDSIRSAIEMAEEEAADYVASVGICRYSGLAQAYLIGEDALVAGS